MKNMWPPQDQVFWYLKRGVTPVCDQDMSVDVAIVGGGMAGLSAAQALSKRGKKVVLLEQYYCGSGASGKSSGFITPNAELSLTDFSTRYNADVAHQIWDFITSGVEDIRRNIKEHNFACDYTEQNSLVVANTKGVLKELELEHNNLAKGGYKSVFYDANQVREHIGSTSYFGGVGYGNTFGITAYAYCQELRQHLVNNNITIFEETPVTKIDGHVLTTPHARITADNIIVCVDRFAPELDLLKKDVYHAQTFLMVSQQLSDAQMRMLFPDNNLMVWDTDLVYSYFRITGDRRLLLGGGNMLKTYASEATHNYAPMIRKLTNYLATRFPELKNIQFEYNWPGLIGLSKDIGPIAGRDKDKPFIYYISAVAGLPIAAAAGRYSVEHLFDGRTDLDPYFSPYRSFPIGGALQSIMGTKATFAFSNLITKYYP